MGSRAKETGCERYLARQKAENRIARDAEDLPIECQVECAPQHCEDTIDAAAGITCSCIRDTTEVTPANQSVHSAVLQEEGNHESERYSSVRRLRLKHLMSGDIRRYQ